MAEFQNVAVIGAGAMGAGIAQTCAAAGYKVTMTDTDQQFVEGGFARIRGPLEKRVAKGKMTQEQVEDLLGRIKGTTSNAEAVQEADLVIEAVIEDIELKRRTFGELDGYAPDHALLATNTSSLSVTEIASATSRPGQVVGMHFFNPAPVMKLVELIRGSETSDVTFAAASEFCQSLGKAPVEVAEAPGFVVNRLLVPMMNEAFNLLNEGVASAEDIDKAMKLGTNMPMGPLELADYTGLDVGLFVMEVLHRETGDARFRPSPLLRKYVRAGRLGRKSGRGVYDYQG